MNKFTHSFATSRASSVIALTLAAIGLAYSATTIAAEQTPGQPVVCAAGEDKALLAFQVPDYHSERIYDRVRCGPHGWFRSEKGLSAELLYFEKTLGINAPDGAQIVSVIPLDQ